MNGLGVRMKLWQTQKTGNNHRIQTTSPMDHHQMDMSIDSEDWSPMYNVFEEDSNSSCSSLGMSVQSTRTNESEDNELEEDKVCTVCGDKANGYHFHVLTCEGCKGFFRRSISKGLEFTCPFTRTCAVTKSKRRRCQACRLQKCLDVGMRKDMIMTEEALEMRRELRKKKKQERLRRAQQVKEARSLTEEQKQIIAILTDAHNKHFDSSFSQFVDYRPQFIIKQLSFENAPGSTAPPCQPSRTTYQLQSEYTDTFPVGYQINDNVLILPHFADLSTYMIQQVIQFAKAIPAFRSLPIEDQISLLKGSTMEVCQIQFNTVFNLETKQWECGKLKLSIEHGAISGFQKLYLEPLQKFHITLRKLNIHEAEYVLMEALCLLSPDRPDISGRDAIDEIHENIALTLKCYIDSHHPLPEGRFLYPKLLSLLTQLRTLNAESTRQLLHIQDIHADAVTPLMKEFLS
ncbi:nuclear receptor subfamily 1 group I member 3 isoform X1 [Pelobates fuscus]|uniref:nuclear receptor subfamily 1 group I member 3 isoform X1 n=2 Tax=Pelobates fuscus TaxID=191477 RepID=UPI002FE4B83A